MKKCMKLVFVSLLVVLAVGKSVWASSTTSSGKGMTGEEAMKHLRNLKGHIAVLTSRYGTDRETDKQGVAMKNLERASKHSQGRPILERAFEDAEKESRAYKISEKAEEAWWNNFFAIRRTYLGK
jgi:hypothetical protein